MINKECPNCKSNKITWWHFYNNYGTNGAFACHKCGSVFKAVKPRGLGLFLPSKFRIGKMVRKGNLIKNKEEITNFIENCENNDPEKCKECSVEVFMECKEKYNLDSRDDEFREENGFVLLARGL